jgi:hypothetical protein
MLVMELEGPDGDADERREAVDLGRDERRVIVPDEHEHEKRRRSTGHRENRALREPLAEAPRRPGRAPVGGEAFAAEERRPQKRGGAVLERRQVGHRRRDRTEEAVAFANADAAGLGEDELECRTHEVAARLACGPGDGDRRARVRHRDARVEQVDLEAVGEDGGRPPERREGVVEPAPGEEEVVDSPARFPVQDLDSDDVDAELGEVAGDRGQAAGTVAHAQADEACAEGGAPPRHPDERRATGARGEEGSERRPGRRMHHVCSFESARTEKD